MAPAFKNSSKLLKEAFAAEDPLPPLTDLLKTHSTLPAVQELVTAYVEAVKANPSRGQFLASTLYKLGHSTDPGLARLTTALGGEPLWGIINDELFDSHHFRAFYKGPTRWGPGNHHLLDSLLSALSMRHDLSITGNQLGAISEGLDADKNDKNAQEIVIGACIQLLLAGSLERVIAYVGAPQEVATKLKKQKANKVVENENAIKLLDLTIEHAEKGLKAENQVDDVFALLFPGVSYA